MNFKFKSSTGFLIFLITAVLSIIVFMAVLRPILVREGTIPRMGGQWQLIRHIGGGGNSLLKRPMQVIWYKDKLYVSDSGTKQILLLSINGDVVQRFGGDAPGKLIFPYGMAVYEGKLLVSDIQQRQILIFTLDGHYTGKFADGAVRKPAGMAVSGDRLFVTDLERHQVLVFNKNGKLLSQWGSGRQGSTYNDFAFPNDITVSGQEAYVSDTGNNRVEIFSVDGKYLRTIAPPEKGILVNNRGVAVTPQGNLLVASAMSNQVLLFSPKNQFQGSFGSSGGSESLRLPNGVAITKYQGQNIIAVADKGNNRVSLYVLPKEW